MKNHKRDLNKNKDTQKYLRYLPGVIVVVLIYSPFLFSNMFFGISADKNIWYSLPNALFFFTLFAGISVWLITSVISLQSRIRYLVLFALVLLGFFIEVSMVFIFSPVLDYFVFIQGYEKLCSKQTINAFTLLDTHSGTMVTKACNKLNLVTGLNH